MKLEQLTNKTVITGMLGISMLVGVLGGATLLSVVKANAQTPPATPAVAATDTTLNKPQSGSFKSNEDPTHEARESPEREAQENAGQFPTGK